MNESNILAEMKRNINNSAGNMINSPDRSIDSSLSSQYFVQSTISSQSPALSEVGGSGGGSLELRKSFAITIEAC